MIIPFSLPLPLILLSSLHLVEQFLGDFARNTLSSKAGEKSLCQTVTMYICVPTEWSKKKGLMLYLNHPAVDGFFIHDTYNHFHKQHVNHEWTQNGPCRWSIIN